MATYIYPTEGGSYLKVCDTPQMQGCRNKGCLQHMVNSGTLNLKEELVFELQRNGVFPLRHPMFRPSMDGRTRDHRGAGYVGWIEFNNVDDGIDYLKKNLDVVGVCIG